MYGIAHNVCHTKKLHLCKSVEITHNRLGHTQPQIHSKYSWIVRHRAICNYSLALLRTHTIIITAKDYWDCRFCRFVIHLFCITSFNSCCNQCHMNMHLLCNTRLHKFMLEIMMHDVIELLYLCHCAAHKKRSTIKMYAMISNILVSLNGVCHWINSKMTNMYKM